MKRDRSELTSCLERVSRGEIWARQAHSEFLLEALRNSPSCEGIEAGKIDHLSRRELQVVEHAAEGESNKQIAHRLNRQEGWPGVRLRTWLHKAHSLAKDQFRREAKKELMERE